MVTDGKEQRKEGDRRMKYLVGIDNGGTFSKTAVFDEKGKQLASATVPTQTLTPEPGYAQRDMNELWKVNAKSIKRAIDESGVDPEKIAGVSFSGHGKGLYLVGADRTSGWNSGGSGHV